MGDWKEIIVGNSAEILAGYAFDSNQFVDKSKGIPLIRIRDLKRGYTVVNYAGKFQDRYVIEEGDVLIGMDGDFHVVRWKGIKALLNQRVLKVTTKSGLDNKLLYYFLIGELLKIQNQTTGTTVKHLSNSDVAEIRIKVPDDISEQSIIATILTTIDQAIEKTEQLIAKYERIKTGLMQDLLTCGIDEQGNIRSEETHEFKDSPLGRIPREWEVVNFGKYVELVHGYQFRNYDFTDAGIPIVKISQVTESGLDISSCSFIDKNRLSVFEEQIIKNGDVLMALTGATLGKACLVSDLTIPVLQNYRVGRFEPVKENEVDKTYLYYTLTTKEFLNQIFSKVNTGAQGNIGKADFVKARFILPNIQEQEKIGKLLNGIQRLMEEESYDLEKNKILKTALMQDLLTGKVRVDALIENIKANV